jgi:hypothetical protein
MLEVSTLIFLVGISETRLLVPFFLPPHLSGAVDHYFYETSFHSCCKMWILRLGFIYGSRMVVLHHIFAAGVILDVFPEQRRGRCGPKSWLALSPDFNPPSFYFYSWGHLKSTLDAAGVSDVQVLQQRIQNAFEMYHTKLGIVQRFKQSLFQTCNVLCWRSR